MLKKYYHLLPHVAAMVGFLLIMFSYQMGFSSAREAGTIRTMSSTGKMTLTYVGLDKEFALLEVQKWRIIGSIIMVCGLLRIRGRAEWKIKSKDSLSLRLN